MDTIAIVDDDLISIDTIQTLLKNDRYSFLRAYNGKDAQNLLNIAGNQVKSIILDWMMPKMDGIDLLRWIKAQPHLKNIPVVMLTANDTMEHIREGIEAGAYYYLTKPIQGAILQSIVKSAIRDFNLKISLLKKIKEGENVFRLLKDGEFYFKTISEGKGLAINLANTSGIPEAGIGLNELFVNAVEHGNFCITYDEKTLLVNNNIWENEVSRLQALPENRHKSVKVCFHTEPDSITITIEDQGKGFNFDKYLRLDEKRVFDTHGRGIITAVHYLSRLTYTPPGNKITIEFNPNNMYSLEQENPHPDFVDQVPSL